MESSALRAGSQHPDGKQRHGCDFRRRTTPHCRSSPRPARGSLGWASSRATVACSIRPAHTQMLQHAAAMRRVLAATAGLTAFNLVVISAGEPALAAGGAAVLSCLSLCRFTPLPSLLPLQPTPQFQAHALVGVALVAPAVATVFSLMISTVRWTTHLARQTSAADMLQVALGDVQRTCGTPEARLLSLGLGYACTWALPTLQVTGHAGAAPYRQPQWQALGLACVRCALMTVWLALTAASAPVAWKALLWLNLVCCYLSLVGGLLIAAL